MRPPAVPLVTCDPYFSIWSNADRLTDDATRHWTRKPHRLTSLVRIDGHTFRVMGDEPRDIPPLAQVVLDVLPTRTVYDFEGAGVHLTLTFMTAALPDDLMVLSRPVTYLTWELRSVDGKPHQAAVYFDHSAELAVHDPGQTVTWSREKIAGLAALRMGSSEQPVLARKGDDTRIDWGYVYLAAPQSERPSQAIATAQQARESFSQKGTLAVLSEARPASPVALSEARPASPAALSEARPASPAAPSAAGQRERAIHRPNVTTRTRSLETGQARFLAARASDGDDTRMPRAVKDDAPVSALAFDLGSVGARPVSRWLMLAYDDLYSIQFFGKNLRPYWRRDGADAAALLTQAGKDYAALRKRCEAFDAELMADMTRVGGERYARMGALAYRQALAGNKIAADPNGQPLLFPKENTSNGCIATVDVIYPMAPEFLLFSPTLTRAMLVHILEYSSSPRWRFPFAPHDLGTYPKANGQVYGGGERTENNQMPVEETGNMLILLAGLAQIEGNADFAGRFWPVVTKWAEFLKTKGFDPENQLCTDDFAGHLAHNVNLSAKAIVGLGAYARLSEMRGDKASAASYRNLAREFAARWVKEADDGDHFRLAFDKPGTWSQKYNLVWDRILGLNLFPPEVLAKEMAFYKTTLNRYGLPLDNRRAYAKLDWSMWTATLTGSRADFEAIASPVYDFLNDTPQRVPMNDLYWTQDAREASMHARPVVGGVFLKMLYDRAVWKKWASRDKTRTGNWAPLPEPPQITTVIPAAEKEPLLWRYATERPAPNWAATDFDASAWKEGPAGFGAGRPPGSVIRTPWNTPDIWLRREITMPEGKWTNLNSWIHHDEDVEVYINGVLASRSGGYLTQYEPLAITSAARTALKPGKNVIAVHCHQTTGGQYIDLGLVDVKEAPRRNL